MLMGIPIHLVVSYAGAIWWLKPTSVLTVVVIRLVVTRVSFLT